MNVNVFTTHWKGLTMASVFANESGTGIINSISDVAHCISSTNWYRVGDLKINYSIMDELDEKIETNSILVTNI